VLAYLVTERKRAVTQSELAEALWPESLPASWTLALSAIISRLRARLATLGLVRSHIIGNAFGCYQFSAPTDTWVDLEAALAGVDAAEGFVAAGNPQGAYGPSLIATTILRRPFLPGDLDPWAEGRRRELATRWFAPSIAALRHWPRMTRLGWRWRTPRRRFGWDVQESAAGAHANAREKRRSRGSGQGVPGMQAPPPRRAWRRPLQKRQRPYTGKSPADNRARSAGRGHRQTACG
jgi:hypothetical protein